MDNKLFWKTREGRVLDVDLMSDAHVRNAFKMLLRNNASLRASDDDVSAVYANYIMLNTPKEIFSYSSPYNKMDGAKEVVEPVVEVAAASWDDDWFYD